MKKKISDLRPHDEIILPDSREVMVVRVTELSTGDYELWWHKYMPDRVSEGFYTYIAGTEFEVISSDV